MPPATTSTPQTEFVQEAFETTVEDETEVKFLEAIDNAVSQLREQIDDDTLENILRADAGSYRLRSDMTRA